MNAPLSRLALRCRSTLKGSGFKTAPGKPGLMYASPSHGALRLLLLIILACACLAGPTTAQAPDGTDATFDLSWTHAAGNQAYQVHRDTTPYFAPADATRRTIVTAAPWSYTDPDVVIGDPNINHYYVLRATCAAAYADAGDRVGEFDFALEPGG